MNNFACIFNNPVRQMRRCNPHFTDRKEGSNRTGFLSQKYYYSEDKKTIMQSNFLSLHRYNISICMLIDYIHLYRFPVKLQFEKQRISIILLLLWIHLQKQRKVVLYHPGTLSGDKVFQSLTGESSRHNNWKSLQLKSQFSGNEKIMKMSKC